MNHKVLLADDSLTIQKVIKITLANQPYDIVDCSSEEELFQKLPSVKPKIVFLDFNLSDKHTGYELTTKIKEMLPAAKVLLLLGTFDNIDDAAFEKSGASEKIVKPFDSNKFIAICKQLVDLEPDTQPTALPKATPKALETSPADDQWTMSHSTERKLPTFESKPEAAPKSTNPLHTEMSSWGMSVPGVIGGNSAQDSIDLPPVIGGSKVEAKPAARSEQKPEIKAEPKVENKHAAKLPSADDLDYPTIEDLTRVTEESSAPKSNLISIDSFRQDNNDFQMEGNYVPDESDVQSIQDQIRDEVEEDLWKVDEFEDLKKEISSKVEQMQESFQPTMNEFDENMFRPIDDKDSISWTDVGGKEENKPSSQINFNQETQAMTNLHGAEMEDLIKRYVKEYMDEMFKQKVEKIAWEVIPDLAENLIRQELSKIADRIIRDSK